MSSYYSPFDDAKNELQQLRAFWKQYHRPILGALVALVVVIGLFTSYYQVATDEVGVVLRFGKYVGTTEPGLRFKLPFGIDQVIKVPVMRQLKMEFGYRTVRAGVRSQFAHDDRTAREAKMLTGDLNVGMVEWSLQYRIVDPVKYLFSFRNVDATLRLMAEATMRSVVGDHSLDELITGGREAIEDEAKKKFEDLNKLYDTGISLQQLKLQDANVPDVVKPALREVEEAKQEKARAINEAEADYNKVIPEARGQAQASIEAAHGYATARVNEAEGDATRFRDLYAEYRKTPNVTRTRLYLEALGKILPKTEHKVIIDSTTKGVLPLLDLAKAFGKGGAK